MRRTLPLVAILLAACASGPAGDEGPAEANVAERYSGREGESPVGVIPDVVFRDESRGSDVTVTIEYPTRTGSNPVIIFSHGFGGSNRSYVALSSFWASQGYVVIKPKHSDSGALRNLESLDEIWDSQSVADWRNRVRDVVFLIDSLASMEKRFPELQGKIDATRVGVGGHSYGAHTAMLVGGATTYPGPVRYADPRVKAIVAMSPQGPAGDRGLTRESWAGLEIPALFMTGNRDRGIGETETPEWRREAFALSPAGDKWFVSIQGARHASFTGRLEGIDRRDDVGMQSDPFRDTRTDIPRARSEGIAYGQREIFRKISGISLAFWDAYLREGAEGREALARSGERSGVTLERK